MPNEDVSAQPPAAKDSRIRCSSQKQHASSEKLKANIQTKEENLKSLKSKFPQYFAVLNKLEKDVILLSLLRNQYLIKVCQLEILLRNEIKTSIDLKEAEDLFKNVHTMKESEKNSKETEENSKKQSSFGSTETKSELKHEETKLGTELEKTRTLNSRLESEKIQMEEQLKELVNSKDAIDRKVDKKTIELRSLNRKIYFRKRLYKVVNESLHVDLAVNEENVKQRRIALNELKENWALPLEDLTHSVKGLSESIIKKTDKKKALSELKSDIEETKFAVKEVVSKFRDEIFSF